MRHDWSCLFRTDPSCHHKGSLEPSQSLISKFIMLFSIYKVKKISTTARWLGNCIILLLSSVLPINLVAKAGPDARGCRLGQLWEWEPGSPPITSVPKEGLSALAGQPQSYRKLLLQEESETGVGSEEWALHPPIREKKYYQCREVVTK